MATTNSFHLVSILLIAFAAVASSSSSTVSTTTAATTTTASTTTTAATTTAADTTTTAATTTAAATTTTAATNTAAATTTTAATNTAAATTTTSAVGATTTTATAAPTTSVTPSASTTTIAGNASTTSTPVPTTTSSAVTTAASTTTVSSAATTSIQASTTAASSSSSVPTAQTTTKPTTAPKETFEAQVSAQMKLPKQWVISYSDLNSYESMTLINEITVSMKKVHNNTEVKINSISQGSVVVNFTIIFKNVVSGSDPVKSFQDAVKAGTFKVGNVTVDANSLVISVQYKGVTLIWKLDTDVYLKECCKSHIGKAKEKQECETNTTTCAAVPKETRELDCGKALNMKPPGCPSKACGLTCFSTAIMLLGILASKIIF